MHINSPFAALSFLISYSTSMIVSYYLCFTGGLFIERAEQLTLLFSELVCLRPADFIPNVRPIYQRIELFRKKVL